MPLKKNKKKLFIYLFFTVFKKIDGWCLICDANRECTFQIRTEMIILRCMIIPFHHICVVTLCG